MTETKPSALVSPVLDAGLSHSLFATVFIMASLSVSSWSKKLRLSKQPPFPFVVSGNNSTIASGRMLIPYGQEAKIPRSVQHDYLVFESETQAQIYSVHFLIACIGV